jgi:phosphoribosylformylglycinamidine synthase
VARVIVEVMLKPEIHDPQGEAIAGACHRLGFGQVTGVRQGKRFEVELGGPADEAALARIAELAGELLATWPARSLCATSPGITGIRWPVSPHSRAS